MREITLAVESPQIKINGAVFDLQLSDMEIYARAQALNQKLQKYNEKPLDAFATEEILADVAEAAGLLDEILGTGATRKISRGRPVRLALALKWLNLIATEAANHYAELVTGEE